jgi:hypothetical protein
MFREMLGVNVSIFLHGIVVVIGFPGFIQTLLKYIGQGFWIPS